MSAILRKIDKTFGRLGLILFFAIALGIFLDVIPLLIFGTGHAPDMILLLSDSAAHHPWSAVIQNLIFSFLISLKWEKHKKLNSNQASDAAPPIQNHLSLLTSGGKKQTIIRLYPVIFIFFQLAVVSLSELLRVHTNSGLLKAQTPTLVITLVITFLELNSRSTRAYFWIILSAFLPILILIALAISTYSRPFFENDFRYSCVMIAINCTNIVALSFWKKAVRNS